MADMESLQSKEQQKEENSYTTLHSKFYPLMAAANHTAVPKFFNIYKILSQIAASMIILIYFCFQSIYMHNSYIIINNT